MMDDATKVAVLTMLLQKTKEQRNNALDLIADLLVAQEIAQQQIKALQPTPEPSNAVEPVAAKANGSAEHIAA